MKLRVCPVCSKEFRVTEWEFKHDLHTFCTISCRKMFLRTLVECKECKRTFTVFKSVVKRERGKFCSSQCYRSFWVNNYSSALAKMKRHKSY
jgi:hypothetical protein